jgi:serine/threonine-protein kinase
MSDLSIVSSILARWEDERSAGRMIPVEELCRAHPLHADRLVEEIDRRKQLDRKMEWLGQPSAERSGGQSAAPADTSGTVLDGRYRLELPIGRGGFGTVWVATDLRTHESVAVKLPRNEPSPHPPGLTAGREEYSVLDRLRHPSIVPVYGKGVHDGKVYIVFKLMTGGTLADAIRRGPVRVKEALLVVRDIAEAVLFIHHHGIIHRDLKPRNVLLDAAGRAYLTDFGLALCSPPGNFATPEKTGGTEGYSAPEQFEAGARIDHRCDQYALGVLLFELLTGRRPAALPDESEVAANGCRGGAWAGMSNERGVPRRLRPLIRRCLAESPANRFISVCQFIDAIDMELDRRGVRRPGVPSARNPRRAPTVSARRFLSWSSRLIHTAKRQIRGLQLFPMTWIAIAITLALRAVPLIGLDGRQLAVLLVIVACVGTGMLFAGRLRLTQVAILIVAIAFGIWISRPPAVLWNGVSTGLSLEPG